MFQHILVPLDGSKHAEQAIPAAARIARATGGSLIFLHVVFAPADVGYYPGGFIASPEETCDAQMMKAEAYLSSLVETAYANDLAGIPTKREVELGNVAPTIFTTARQKHIDLIVMCSREETRLKRWVFSSVSHEAVHHTPVPVLVLHEHSTALPTPTTFQPLHVLVPLDGSPLAECALHLTHVLKPLAAHHEREEARKDLACTVQEAKDYLQRTVEYLRESGRIPASAGLSSHDYLVGRYRYADRVWDSPGSRNGRRCRGDQPSRRL